MPSSSRSAETAAEIGLTPRPSPLHDPAHRTAASGASVRWKRQPTSPKCGVQDNALPGLPLRRRLNAVARDADARLYQCLSNALNRHSRGSRPLRNPISLPPSGGKVRMGGKTRSISAHGSPPSQSSPFEGEEVLADGDVLFKGLFSRELPWRLPAPRMRMKMAYRQTL